jgi:hypothetical protein
MTHSCALRLCVYAFEWVCVLACMQVRMCGRDRALARARFAFEWACAWECACA